MIIMRHRILGSTIYPTGWSGYSCLNMGYQHFFTWPCRHTEYGKGKTEYSIAFLNHSHFLIQDVMELVTNILLGSSLKVCTIQTGMDYKKTSVDWEHFVPNCSESLSMTSVMATRQCNSKTRSRSHCSDVDASTIEATAGWA